MHAMSAPVFLERFAQYFERGPIRTLRWGGEDSDFGRIVEWDVQKSSADDGITVDVNASLDLQETQATLCISECDTSVDPKDIGAEVTFTALIQFEDKTLTVNGEELEYSEESIRDVIRQFNERAS